MASEKERQALIAAYPNPKWKRKVVQMADNQVIAVYKRLQTQGKV